MESSHAIRAAIVHKLQKTQGDLNLRVDPRHELLPINHALQSLVEMVHDAYGKRVGKSYGAFQEDATIHPAQTIIRQLVGQGPDTFVDHSKALLNLLADKAKRQAFATGGYVLMVDSTQGGTHWFLVAVLTDVAGAAITNDLNVIESNHLDLSAMRFAGRVNISEWEAGAERYISFLRGKRADVSDYFQDFFGCATRMKDSEDTQRMVAAIKKFAADQQLDEARREQLLGTVDTIGRTCIKNKTPLDLESLANQVWPDNPELLLQALAESDPPISDGFIPDGRSLLPLRKFRAKTKTWTLEFDRGAMNDHTIRYDAANRELKITKIPDDIAAQLQAEFSNDEEQ